VARENNLAEFRLIFSVGADVDAQGSGSWTSLLLASCREHVRVVKELMDHEAGTNEKANDGNTPLHFACGQGHLAVVKELLSGGANILTANNQVDLPVLIAVSWRNSAVAKYRLQQLYAITRRLPLHELLEDLTWIAKPRRSDAPPLRPAFTKMCWVP
jgi:ankyrin repeat protein